MIINSHASFFVTKNSDSLILYWCNGVYRKIRHNVVRKKKVHLRKHGDVAVAHIIHYIHELTITIQ